MPAGTANGRVVLLPQAVTGGPSMYVDVQTETLIYRPRSEPDACVSAAGTRNLRIHGAKQSEPGILGLAAFGRLPQLDAVALRIGDPAELAVL